MELPRKVAVGNGVVLELPEICADLKLEPRALIVTGPHTDDVVGKAIFKMLEDGGFQPETLICSASKMEEVDRAERLALELEAGFLIGAGGGRSIDIAKLASLRVDLPFLSVPTAASHDGICSAQASLTINGETASVPAHAPLAIVADTKIISQAPARLLAAGCGDIISNYTAILDWQLAHRLRNEEYSEYASALSGMTARMIVELAPDIRQAWMNRQRLWSRTLISSGVAMSIAGSSRPASGSEHKFAHAMNRIAPGRALPWRALRPWHHNDDVSAWRGLGDDPRRFGPGGSAHDCLSAGPECRTGDRGSDLCPQDSAGSLHHLGHGS